MASSPGTGSSAAIASAPESRAREVVERFVRAMEHQDLAAVVALYAPDAAWEVHVPGWDAAVTDRAELRELHEGFFGRDEFRVEGCQLVEEGTTMALRWGLTWRDREDGAPCLSFQSHFCEVAGDRIRRHRMYCTGVRVRE